MQILQARYKMWRLISIYCIIAITQIYSVDAEIDSSLLCTNEFCNEYLAENDCPNIPDHCTTQNDTHSGVLLPSPTLCNCCQFCLTHLSFNETCTIGGLGSPPTGSVCGPGLYCTPNVNQSGSRCQRMDSPCLNAQIEYDEMRMNGNLGFLQERPVCDDKGDYGPVACIPGQTCFCLNKYGDKIYGEVINERSVARDMKCECARAADVIDKLLGAKISHNIRCYSNGSYDSLQCIGNRCFCVSQDTGILSDNKIIDWRFQALTELPCYNEEIHQPRSYLKECEEEKLAILKMVVEFAEDGFTYFGNPVPDCQPDGNYHKIQRINGSMVCVTPENIPIEDFSVPLGGRELESMNCNCARTRHLLKSVVTAHRIPQCCSNGNWKQYQCHQNNCYRVNQNGQQIEKEIKMDSLDGSLLDGCV